MHAGRKNTHEACSPGGLSDQWRRNRGNSRPTLSQHHQQKLLSDHRDPRHRVSLDRLTEWLAVSQVSHTCTRTWERAECTPSRIGVHMASAWVPVAPAGRWDTPGASLNLDRTWRHIPPSQQLASDRRWPRRGRVWRRLEKKSRSMNENSHHQPFAYRSALKVETGEEGRERGRSFFLPSPAVVTTVSVVSWVPS